MTAFVRQLLQARLARRNHCHLGHREHAVEHKQEKQDKDFHDRQVAGSRVTSWLSGHRSAHGVFMEPRATKDANRFPAQLSDHDHVLFLLQHGAHAIQQEPGNSIGANSDNS